MADPQVNAQQGDVTVNQSGSSVFGDVVNKYIYQIGREYVEGKGVPATPQNVEDAVMGISQNPEIAKNTPTGKKLLDYVFGKEGQGQDVNIAQQGQGQPNAINIPIDNQPVNNVVQGQDDAQVVPQQQLPIQDNVPSSGDEGFNPLLAAVPAAAAAGGYQLAKSTGGRNIVPGNGQAQPVIVDPSSSPIEGDLLDKQAQLPGQQAQSNVYEGQVNRPQLNSSPNQLPNQQQAQLAQSLEAEQAVAQEFQQTGKQPVKQLAAPESAPIETGDIMANADEIKPTDTITSDDGTTTKSKSGKVFEKATDAATGKTIYTSGNTKFVADEAGNLYPVPVGVTDTPNDLGVNFMKQNAANNANYRKFIRLLRIIR